MIQKITKNDLIKLNDFLYEIPLSYRSDMKVPAHIFMNESIMNDILTDNALLQLVNVATLPGIQKKAFAMPDIHHGYGFPIGGVAAMTINEYGVISPGGIGYDINCGVRLLGAKISTHEAKPFLKKFATLLFKTIPSGVGKGGQFKCTPYDLDSILKYGAQRMLEMGYGNEQDLELCEEQGCMQNADPKLVSEQAKERGKDQLGTLGSGNHFLEIQTVDEIYNQEAATIFGIEKDSITIMVHCGSRGLGHQTCTDYIRAMMQTELQKLQHSLPDKELIYTPFLSTQGQSYFNAMAAAANYAWANRHLINHWIRQSWEHVFGKTVPLDLIYDVSHNLAKVETHSLNGLHQELLVHRKGATRAFGPGRIEIPLKYRNIGQPVLIPGTMGTSSYILKGTHTSMNLAFGSSCHGAGRRLSREQAKKKINGNNLRTDLEAQGIQIYSDSNRGLAEEAPLAYKNVDMVAHITDSAGLAQKVAKLKPIAVIKGD